MPLLRVMDICKSFSGRPVLDHVNIGFEKNKVLCLLGPSGCGKTTLLRIIAGLETADSGEVRFQGKCMDGIPPFQRQFGLMFQEFALFPHKTVFDNVAFGLQVLKQSRTRIDRHVRKILETVDLVGFENRPVNDLSGGERQRVALARSLAPAPRLLMLDEPLGALDRALRERLLLDMKRILGTVAITAIWVTHDQAEAFAVADSIAVMLNGRVRQISSPERLYKKPESVEVAQFLGFHNILKGRIRDERTVETEAGSIPCAVHGMTAQDRKVKVLIRPEAAGLAPADANFRPPGAVLQGKLRHALFKGSFYQVRVVLSSGTRLSFQLPNDVPLPPPGEDIRLVLNPAGVQVIPDETESFKYHNSDPRSSA